MESGSRKLLIGLFAALALALMVVVVAIAALGVVILTGGMFLHAKVNQQRRLLEMELAQLEREMAEMERAQHDEMMRVRREMEIIDAKELAL